MKAVEVLSRVKETLGMQVALEQKKLENGTILEAEKFEAEQPVFIVTDDEKVPLPVGEYDMEDGEKLAVVEEGVIAEIVDKLTEKEEAEKEEVEMKEELEEKKEEMSYVTKEELEHAVEELTKAIEEVKAKYEAGYDDKEEELAKVKSEAEELKEELSKPASNPIKHSPETRSRGNMQKLASRGRATALDRVFSRITQ